MIWVRQQKCVFKVSWRKKEVLDSKEADSVNLWPMLCDQGCMWLRQMWHGLFFLWIRNWDLFNMWAFGAKVVIWLCMTPTHSRQWGVEEWEAEDCGLESCCMWDFPREWWTNRLTQWQTKVTILPNPTQQTTEFPAITGVGEVIYHSRDNKKAYVPLKAHPGIGTTGWAATLECSTWLVGSSIGQ